MILYSYWIMYFLSFNSSAADCRTNHTIIIMNQQDNASKVTTEIETITCFSRVKLLYPLLEGKGLHYFLGH